LRFGSTKSKAPATIIAGLELISGLSRGVWGVERIVRYDASTIRTSSGCEWICITLEGGTTTDLLGSERGRLLLHLEWVSYRRLLLHWLGLELIDRLLELEAVALLMLRLHLTVVCNERRLARLKLGWCRSLWLLEVVGCSSSLERIAELGSLLRS